MWGGGGGETPLNLTLASDIRQSQNLVALYYGVRIFQNRQKLITGSPLFEYDVNYGFHCVATAKLACIRNFFIIALFYNGQSFNLVEVVKTNLAIQA